MSTTEHYLWRHNVAAIITDDEGNILLGGSPEHDSHWHFPQGGVKEGECAREALQRELREEVGLRRYRVLAEYPGLRYEYRRKNEKSKRWLGQQQVYYLLHTPGVMPATDCTGSAEFTATRWVHFSRIDSSLFVPFKREVAARALAHFFPSGRAFSPAACTPLLYLCQPGMLPPPPAPGTPLFGSGKDEAACHLERLVPGKPGKEERTLAVLLEMQGAGCKKALRHISHALDPLTTRYTTDPRRYGGLHADLLPLPGELSVLALPADARETSELALWLSRCRADGLRLLTIALYISRDKQLERLARKGKSPRTPWDAAWRTFQHTLSALPEPYYLIPADTAWYRDYMLCSLLTSALTGGPDKRG